MKNLQLAIILSPLAIVGLCVVAAARDPVPLRSASIDRPLRYTPDNGDFVIENGTELFNRPLYTAHTPCRVDAGDRPEFAFCFPTKGGVLRLGIAAPAGAKWLIDADKIMARYRPGMEIYEISDSLTPGATLTVAALPTQQTAGLVVSATLSGGGPVDLIWAYGGGTGENSRTHFDLNGDPNLARVWNLQPADCEGAKVAVAGTSFSYTSAVGTMTCTGPAGGRVIAGDSSKWESAKDLLDSKATNSPVAVGRAAIGNGIYVAIQKSDQPVADPAALFAESERYREQVAQRVTVDTPDPFINASIGAMCIAADDIFQSPTFMHGANAWRTPLLGWRGPYAMDVLGWHDRAQTHLSYWASRQNTDATDAPTVAVADPAKNLAENDWKMLHSYGNIPQTHYDMDLAFIDELYWHFFWTGDVEYVRKMWPVITRHLAWEKRCFDRDGLYEGYACIWASDGLEYNGGGAAHSTAYNYLHNLLAARMARVIGEDPAPYEKEAQRIHDAMESRLWLPRLGWYGEYQDLLGLKRVHPDAAVWTVYHSIDSRVPDPFETYQLLRYVDTQIPHIPVRGPGVPAGDFHVVSESNWQPYEWSLNNVVMAEVAHTALAYWEGGRPEEAWKLFKGTILDSMYLGVCPGDLPNLSFYDDYRGESYRDFGDTTGSTSRTFIEGLFGILPDALAGELTIRPGFPGDWDHASIRTPDVQYSYKRDGESDDFTVVPTFARAMSLKLIWPARLDHVAAVRIDGRPAPWSVDETAIGAPRIVVTAAAAARFDVSVQWSGAAPARAVNPPVVAPGEAMQATVSPAQALEVRDPQTAWSVDRSLTGIATGEVGHRTAFVKVRQGDLTWWLPINFEIRPLPQASPPAEPKPQALSFTTVDLSSVFNDRVTQIFRNRYLSPRTPYCSLQMPVQGIGVWSTFNGNARIDDSGLRRAAGAAGRVVTPSGIPFLTPGGAEAKNIAFTSRWDNYPVDIRIPVSGQAAHAYLLMAGSTNPMEAQMDNGEVVFSYADGGSARLALRNPTNWWPIEQDYLKDDYAFARSGPTPTRLALASGRFYVPSCNGAKIAGGAATVVDMPLNKERALAFVTIRSLSNQVVTGLMSLTLAR